MFSATNTMEEIRIILIGESGCGKSATSNRIVGRDIFESKPNSESVTGKARSESTEKDGYHVVVVDTPGINDSSRQNDEIRNELKRSMIYASPGPHAFVFCVAMNNLTSEGSANLKFYQDFFGEKMSENTIVVFTMLDAWKEDRAKQKHMDTAEFIVKHLSQEMRQFLKDCHCRYRFLGNQDDDDDMLFHTITGMTKLPVYTNDLFRKIEMAIDQKMRQPITDFRNEIVKSEDFFETVKNII